MLQYAELTCTIYRPEKTAEKVTYEKLTFANMALLNNFQYQQCPKIKDGQI